MDGFTVALLRLLVTTCPVLISGRPGYDWLGLTHEGGNLSLEMSGGARARKKGNYSLRYFLRGFLLV